MATLGTAGLLIYLQRGAFALLVSTGYGVSQVPQGVERATVQGFTLFLCLYVSSRKTSGCRSPRPLRMGMTFALMSALVSF